MRFTELSIQKGSHERDTKFSVRQIAFRDPKLRSLMIDKEDEVSHIVTGSKIDLFNKLIMKPNVKVTIMEKIEHNHFEL